MEAVPQLSTGRGPPDGWPLQLPVLPGSLRLWQDPGNQGTMETLGLETSQAEVLRDHQDNKTVMMRC